MAFKTKYNFDRRYWLAKNLNGFRLFMDRIDDEFFEKINLEIINGLLLSDASLEKNKSNSNKTAFLLSQSIKNQELVYYTNKFLQDNGFLTYVKNQKRKDGLDIRLRTKYYTIFGSLKKEWYPFGKKIVPDNLVLTEKILAYWFMGDGSSSYVGKNVHVSLSTQGFDDESVEKLIKKLKEELGINARTSKNKKYYNLNYGKMISVRKSSEVVKFMKLVEPFILNSFKYKIKYPDPNSKLKMIENAKIRMKKVMMTVTRDRRGRIVRL